MFIPLPKMLFVLHMITALFMALAMMFGALMPAVANDDQSDDATIIMYHRFGESNLPSTNI